jgi:hypothetical protein
MLDNKILLYKYHFSINAHLVQFRDVFLSFSTKSTKSTILIKLMDELMNEIENKVIKISRVYF